MESVKGVRALVTGGASGIGRGMVEALLDRGAEVAVADIDSDSVDATVDELSHKGRLVGFSADVSVLSDIEHLRERVERTLGPIDILANNAGVIYNSEPLWATPPDMVEWAFSVNVMGVYHGVRAFVPGMIERGRGHVVNTASVGGFLVSAQEAWHQSLYAATKYAVVAFSEGLRLDLNGSGVSVSVLAPSSVATNIAASDRHRPTHLTGPATGDGPSPEFESFISRGLDPRVVGEHVVHAIEHDRFYIFTHPERREGIIRRHDAIIEGLNESSTYVAQHQVGDLQ